MRSASAPIFLILIGSVFGYDLVTTYSGPTFFDGWHYYSHWDNLTNGDVNFVDRETAISSKLTYINDAGHAVVRVDNTTFVQAPLKRNSIMITSKEKYGLGTVWVLDALHVPFGCSVWAAFWSRGANVKYPNGGEIDIFEGINLATNNQMTLHTLPGCTQPKDVDQTGRTNHTDCDSTSQGSPGCNVIDTDPASYGAPFANAGGGVWVAEFIETGTKIWFFSRPDVPPTLKGDSIDTSSLGTPKAYYPFSSCDFNKYFTPQEIVIDITLCGDWAKYFMGDGCPVDPPAGLDPCYGSYVIENKSSYADAYFEISSLKIYAASEGDIASDIADPTPATGSITPNTTAGGPVATFNTGLATRAAWCVHSAYGALMLAFWEILAF